MHHLPRFVLGVFWQNCFTLSSYWVVVSFSLSILHSSSPISWEGNSLMFSGDAYGRYYFKNTSYLRDCKSTKHKWKVRGKFLCYFSSSKLKTIQQVRWKLEAQNYESETGFRHDRRAVKKFFRKIDFSSSGELGTYPGSPSIYNQEVLNTKKSLKIPNIPKYLLWYSNGDQFNMLKLKKHNIFKKQ